MSVKVDKADNEFDHEGVQRRSTLNAKGQEIPDPVPLAPPVGFNREPSMAEKIRAMVRSEHLRLAAIQEGKETFEEADDFEVGDDFDPSSPYEEVFDPIDEDVRRSLRNAEYRAEYEKRLKEFQPVQEVPDGDVTARSDEGRKERDRGRSAKSSGKSQSSEGKDETAAVRGGVRERDSGSDAVD